MELPGTQKEATAQLSDLDDSLILTDVHGKVTALTKGAEQLIGCTEAEARGQSLAQVLQIIHAQSTQGISPFLDRARREGHTIGLPQPLILITKHGTRRPIDGKIVPIKDEAFGFAGYVVILQDLIEKQDAIHAKCKANQMDTISFIASGVAHDLNNELTTILGNISLIKSRIDPDHPDFIRLDETENAALRAHLISRRLFKLAQESFQEPTLCCLRKLLTQTAELAISGSNVRCIFEIAADLWLVRIDESQFAQVISNLVINARQAMPNGGVMTLTATNEWVPNGHDTERDRRAFVKITVTDTGSGIAPEHLPRIFDPYFTTKKQGTGLGLAITDTIIRNHHGSIRVESTLGQGTTFAVYLPAVLQKSDEPPASSCSRAQRQGKILVIEDEPAVLNMIRTMLTRSGYACEATLDGREALEWYQQALTSQEPFDACIVDLTSKAGLGAPEILSELRGMHPEVKAIVTTGHTFDPIVQEATAHGFSAALPKPYTLDQLLNVLSNVLLPPHESEA